MKYALFRKVNLMSFLKMQLLLLILSVVLTFAMKGYRILKNLIIDYCGRIRSLEIQVRAQENQCLQNFCSKLVKLMQCPPGRVLVDSFKFSRSKVFNFPFLRSCIRLY